MRGLVVGQVVVTPDGGAGDPLEVVVGEVGRHELVLLVDVVGGHGVHGGHVGGPDLHGLPCRLAAGPAGVDAVGAGGLVGVGHGLVGLPQRQRPEAGVGGQQVDQVGRPRPGQAHHDHGGHDRDVEDLGVAGQQVGDAQAVGRRPHAVVEHEEAAQAGALGVGVHLLQLHRQALPEVVGPEVVEAGAGRGRLAHRGHRQLGGVGLAVVEADALDVVQDRLGQVVDADLAHRRVTCRPYP